MNAQYRKNLKAVMEKSKEYTDNIYTLATNNTSGTNTSTNILAFTSNKGVYIGTDTGHWYYWNGSQYVDGGVYQATQISDGSVSYIKLDDNLKAKINNNNSWVWDLKDERYWQTGAINATSGNVDYGNRLRTTLFILLQDNDVIMFDNSLDTNIFYQIREYNAPFNNSNFNSPAIGEVNDITIGLYKFSSRVIRIVVVADNTSYTTVSEIVSKINIKIIHNADKVIYNKLNGLGYKFTNLSWQDGGLNNSYNTNAYGTQYDGNTDYQASIKRNQNKIMVNPKSIYKFISLDKNIYVKVWGYNSPIGWGLASIDTFSTSVNECEITGYPYIRIVIYSVNLDTNVVIPITDLSTIIDKIYMVEIPDNYTNEFLPQVKLKYGTWNVGHYAFGSQYEPSQQVSAIKNYIKFIGTFETDIMTFVEDNNHCFDVGKTKDLYKNLYSIFYKWYDCGKQYTYNCNSVASFYPIISASEHDYTDMSQHRYYLDSVVNIKGKMVHIISTHLDWDNRTYRQSQIAELISLVSNYDYFIISGDFNTLVNGVDVTSEDIQPFIDAGYNVANGGNFGYITTAYDRDTQNAVYIDNIVTSPNIKITNVKAIETELSDHYPLIADLIID